MASKTVTVMTLGDSITDGLGSQSYRPELAKQLQAAGITPTFVGSQSDGTYHEEGHPGYSISDIAANVDKWIASTHPDVITLMIGTNDVDTYGDGHPDGAAGRLQSLINQITTDAPNAKVIVATIPPNLAGGPVDAYNAAIPGIVSAAQAAGKHVYLADVHSAVSTSDLTDGVHPDAAGDVKIGDAFAPAVINAVNSSDPTPVSAPTPTPAPAPAPAPAPTPAPSADTGSGSDQLTLHVAADTGHGNAQFTVSVDGHQVGGTQTVSASHDAGQWQDITLNGSFGSGAHQVAVNFINDGTGGSHATDTNLYVGGVTLDGQHVDGGAFTSNNASLGYDSSDPHAAVMVVNGTATYQAGGGSDASSSGSSSGVVVSSPTPVSAPAPAPAPAPSGTFDPNNPGGSMVMTFDDEFDTKSFSADSVANNTKWTDHAWYEPSNPGAFSVSNGILSITPTQAAGQTGDNFAQTTNSAGQGWTQKYGYFEASIKMPSGAGTWPSFWLISNGHAQDASHVSPEYDIMEAQGTTDGNGYYTTLHKDSSHSDDQQNADNFITTGDLTSGFHRYGMLWDPNSPNIEFFFDGKLVKTVAKYATTDDGPATMILGDAMGDMIGSNGQNGSTAGHTTMQVDWVHAYQFSSQNPTAVVGGTPAPAPAPAPAPTPAPSADTGDGSDHLTLHVSGDAGHGAAQFVVKVDGQQIGGTQTVSASHDAGQWQDVTLNGSFGTGAHKVEVSFVNDGTGGSHATDTNLYVGGVTLDGQHLDGNAFASNNAAIGNDALDPHAAVMVVNGTATYQLTGGSGSSTGSVSAPTPTPSSGSVPTSANADNSLVLHVSGDQGHGAPQFVVKLDGQQIGGVQTATASHDAGQSQDVALNLGAVDASKAHDLSISFVNDGTGGSHATDTNLYVGGLELNGQHVDGNAVASNNAAIGNDALDPHAAVMVINGTATYHLGTDYWHA